MSDAKELGGSRDKAPLSMALELPLDDLARALAHGAAKYGRGSWLEPGGEAAYLDAAARHVRAHTLGETLDPDSGVSHLAHAAASCLILLGKMRAGVAKRDTAAGTHCEAAGALLGRSAILDHFRDQSAQAGPGSAGHVTFGRRLTAVRD